MNDPSSVPSTGPATGPAGRPAPTAATLEHALFEVKKVIVGQDRAIERMMVCLLARGHALLEGVPGLAKTLAAETLSTVVGGTYTRLQFTPDLLPADITGTRIYRASSETFDVELGPIFANFVLADEINRAPAKVQSALLEVMAEHHVSIGGTTFDVPSPFIVMATQNPIESEGVYALPEAQRDRFLMKIVIDYPSPAEEVEIVHRMGVHPPQALEVLTLDELVALQDMADDVYVDHGVVEYAVNLVLATRTPDLYDLPELTDLLAFGASPRASLGLVAGARALALLRGRTYALPQDVYDVAPDVLRHRLVLVLRGSGPGPHRRPAADPPAEHGAGTSRRPLPGPGGLPSGRDDVASCARRPGADRCSGPARRHDRIHPDLTVRRTELVSSSPTSDGANAPLRLASQADRPPSIATGPSSEVLRRLELTVTRRLDGLLQGDYRGLVPGHGSEPGETRPYAPGDDVRRIDWNVTARTVEPYIRAVHRRPRARDLDPRRLLGQPRLRHRRLREARPRPGRHLGRRVPHPAHRQPHRRGGARGRAGRHPPGPRRAHQHAGPAAPRPARRPSPTTPGRPTSRERSSAWPRPPAAAGSSWSCPTSSPPASGSAPCACSSHRHEVLAVEVVDPRRARAARRRPARAASIPRRAPTREVQTSNAKTRARYAEAAAQQRADIARRIRSAGADHLQLRTDRDWLLDLVRFVAWRRERLESLTRLPS